ncbi:MAG: ribonuclease P protein component [Actinobacteria bacterium]|nr:ribonuclease P protein component [Actinomycetota bacterium]
MLARANRVTLPADFRTAVRRGRRVGTSAAVLHILERPGSEPSRFGFIVTKAVGNAVTRNLVRRRLRSVGREVLAESPTGTDVVMRALPGSEQVPWATLHAEISDGLRKRSRA